MNIWRAANIAWCFLSVPRIASSLLLAPLILGLFVTGSSLVLSFAVRTAPNSETVEPGRRVPRNPVKGLLGVRAPKELSVCYHSEESCQVDRLDIVARPDVLEQVSLAQLRDDFDGDFRRLHVCTNCDSEIELVHRNGKLAVLLKSLHAVMMWESGAFHRLQKQKAQLHEQSGNDDFEVFEAGQFWLFGGKNLPFNASHLGLAAVWILNISLSCLVLAWLGIKSHGRVINYFARNDALQPLIVSLGLKEFYGSIWILTLARVAVFGGFYLVAMYQARWVMGFSAFYETVFRGDILFLVGWLFVLFLQFTTIAMLVSLAEISRDTRATISLVYFPLLTILIGLFVWLGTLTVDSLQLAALREFLLAMPLVSLMPHFLTPIFPCETWVLVMNIFASLIFLLVITRRNTMVFGYSAHLL